MTAAKKKPAKKKPAKGKGRGNPAGPPVRGVRGHSTVDQQPGFREFLTALHLEEPNLTVSEKLERIKGTPFHISRSSLARFGLKFELTKSKKDLIVEMAQRFIDGDQAILAVETATSNLAQTKIFEYLLEHAGDEGLTEKEMELLTLFHRLQTSASSRERAKLAHNRGVKAAVAEIREEMLKILKPDPDTLSRVLRAIEQAAAGARQ